ncbi:MAG: hypothetical protein RLP14_07150 [Owenweeksia sp.]
METITWPQIIALTLGSSVVSVIISKLFEYFSLTRTQQFEIRKLTATRAIDSFEEQIKLYYDSIIMLARIMDEIHASLKYFDDGHYISRERFFSAVLPLKKDEDPSSSISLFVGKSAAYGDGLLKSRSRLLDLLSQLHYLSHNHLPEEISDSKQKEELKVLVLDYQAAIKSHIDSLENEISRLSDLFHKEYLS